jgi:hypothetical protein
MKSAFGAENNQVQRAVPDTLFSENRETTNIIQQVSAHRHVGVVFRVNSYKALGEAAFGNQSALLGLFHLSAIGAQFVHSCI